jgi:hypothetical protein
MCTGIEAVLIASAVAAAGTGYSVYSGEEAKKDAEHRAKQQEGRLQQQQAERDANVGKIRETYGIGGSEAAQTNARTLADSIKQYYNSSLDANLKNADNQFAATSRTSRQNLARVGQLGSGLDVSSKAGTLGDYLKARQSAISSASSSRDKLQSSLTSQRLGYENQVSGGTLANPDFGAMSAQRDAALSQAQSNVTPSAIGNLFNTAGSTYFNGKLQEAQGNQGLSAFNFSNGNNRGSIT